ncbi:hypothetical protein Hanom_Chr05g00468251 [Helianthus anomalus]
MVACLFVCTSIFGIIVLRLAETVDLIFLLLLYLSKNMFSSLFFLVVLMVFLDPLKIIILLPDL